MRGRSFRVLSWIVAALAIGFAVANHTGIIDRVRGLNYATAVAAQYDLSYGPNGPKPIYPGDPAWPIVMRLIREYSSAQLPTNRSPLVIARLRALASVVNTNVPGLPQWTAPTTPIVVLYRPWPDPGASPIGPKDYQVVGTIGDLHNWIARDSDDFRFWTSDVLLAALALLLAAATSFGKA